MNAGYRFMEKLTSTLKGYYQNSAYDVYNGDNNTDRDDNTYKIAAVVGYDLLQNLIVSLEIGYEDRDSNATGMSYQNTFGIISLDYNF
ncbi:hypothetical protein DPPB87 [Desulfotalea psychrophila LSv54]|uniref:Outer membrane protein beta-barrel domain-containing protein n=2 Tax=Desulfotalea psychrophila TaxID=84980 RepID=Q6AI96_DESPS|nr:hypothetical protein DPPB87 [Desulfotalea psychrophila LSv54]